jgi:hypothetical protein
MAMMCLASLVTASKARQTSAKSCKAGKAHRAQGITSFSLDEREYCPSGVCFWEHFLKS